jgi:hypothetical protein
LWQSWATTPNWHGNLPVGDRPKFFTTYDRPYRNKIEHTENARAPRTKERRKRQNATRRHLVFSKLHNSSFSFPFCQKITWHVANVIKATFSLLPFLSIHTIQQFRELVSHRSSNSSTVQNKTTVAQYLFIVSVCFLRWIS